MVKVGESIAMNTEELTSVSTLNFIDAVISTYEFPARVLLHDTTLRDGEQHATVLFDKDDKIAIATMLDEMGVHRIEAGMPAVSPEDRSAMLEITKRVQQAQVFALARSRKDDIDQAVQAGVHGVCIEMVVNDVLAAEVFNWDREEALAMLLEASAYAKSQGVYVTVFMIDSTRARVGWLLEFVRRVAAEGHVDSFAVVDTTGSCSPEAIRWLVGQVRGVWSGSLEIHAHNDFGFGAANTLAALAAGVQTAHVCVNGLGERVGNAPLEQVATSLKYLYGQSPGIDLSMLRRVCVEVERRSGVRRADNQPISGNNIYKIQSGIGAYYWSKVWAENPELFYALHPGVVGHDDPMILLGKLSGSANIQYWADKLSLDLHAEDVPSVVERVKTISTAEKRLVAPEELGDIVHAVSERHVPQ